VSVGFVDGHVDAWFPKTARLPTYAAWLDATLAEYPDVTYYHQHHHYPRWAGKPGDASVPPKPLPDVASFGLGDRPTLLGEYQMRFAAGLTRGAQAAAEQVRKVATWPDAPGGTRRGQLPDAASRARTRQGLRGRARLGGPR
jgi:hypothetical protein